MTRALRAAVQATVLLLAGLATQFVHGQDRSQEPEAEIREFRLLDPSLHSLISVRDEGRQPPYYELALHGMSATTKQEMGPMDSDGTFLRADEFRFDSAADVAEAVGNVTIVVIRDGEAIATMKTDRLRIEGPQP